MTVIEDEWLWGWDPTPGIVSVWAEPDGRAFVWRRIPGEDGALRLVREDARFRPWVVLASLDDLRHLGKRLRREPLAPSDPAGAPPTTTASAPALATAPPIPPDVVTFEELEGPGELRFVVRSADGRALARAILEGASRRLRRELTHLRQLGPDAILTLPPEEQYLVATGRTYFRGLAFDDLRRMQIDLETTGLDPETDRIFLAATRDPDGHAHLLEAHRDGDGDRDRAGDTDPDAAEADLIERLVDEVRRADPDVIENHNLHGFDLPFLARRAHWLGVPLALGRAGKPGLRRRPSARGASLGRAVAPAWGPPLPGDRDPRDPRDPAKESMRRARYTVPGRELIDTMDAVLRHDFSARDLPGHGLKAVARHFGLAREGREHVPGSRVFEVYQRDPARVMRYAADDVTEAAGLARLLGGSAFALARIAPRRYERLADAGPATGVIDPLLVRAYLRSKAALPARDEGDGTEHTGAALHLFATGVAHRIVKADVASLYPSLMRQYRIGPSGDRLGVMVTLVGRLVEQRLAAKAAAKALPKGSPERFTQEALSAAMKLVVNSAYGYLGAVGLTRFSDVHAANEVTRRGREVLALLCRELATRGVTPLEADTDGVYFAVPDTFTEDDERRVVSEVAALLPSLVHLEFDGRYAAMLSHEPKNYALAPHGGGPIVLRGVAFRSSRAEPFGEAFLRRAIARLLRGDVAGVRHELVRTVTALRRREVPTADVTARVRLTKSPQQYLALRAARRELPYEAMLTAGRADWIPGERVRVYRATGGRAGLYVEPPEEDQTPGETEGPREKEVAAPPSRSAPPLGPAGPSRPDTPDYDVEWYVRVLVETFAARLARALAPEDYLAVTADPEQPGLFDRDLSDSRPILTALLDPRTLR